MDEAEVSEEAQVAEDELDFVGDDTLVMYFKAEGTFPEANLSKVQKALEAEENVANVKITISEGCAVVECTKVTTVQATNVSTGLVQVLQSQGFKMQTLILGFDDEDEPEQGFFNFSTVEFADDEGAQRAM